jgi:hypothetical protein
MYRKLNPGMKTCAFYYKTVFLVKPILENNPFPTSYSALASFILDPLIARQGITVDWHIKSSNNATQVPLEGLKRKGRGIKIKVPGKLCWAFLQST